jgi:hypothetical protein
MSWGAQSRSEDAKTPSASRGLAEKSKPELCGIQRYAKSDCLHGSETIRSVRYNERYTQPHPPCMGTPPPTHTHTHTPHPPTTTTPPPSAALASRRSLACGFWSVATSWVRLPAFASGVPPKDDQLRLRVPGTAICKSAWPAALARDTHCTDTGVGAPVHKGQRRRTAKFQGFF